MAKKLKNDPVNILRRAKAYIERHGWTQGSLSKGSRVCVLGALGAVSLGGGPSYTKALDLFSHVTNSPSIPAWNDDKRRKKTEVLSAFQLAISRARRLEKAEARFK